MEKADMGKLAELVLYIVQQSETDRRFGKTKLIKLLAYSDFEAYLRLGRSITGSRYQRLEHGPAPRNAPAVLDRLKSRGDLEERHGLLGSFRHTHYIAHRRPNLTRFNADELEVVNEVLFRFAGAGGRQIRDASHRDFAGWEIVGEYEDIPYRTALLSQEPPAEETLAHGREVMERLANRR